MEDYEVFTSNPEVHWYLAARGTNQAHIDLLHLQGEDPDLVFAHTGYPVAHMGPPKDLYPVIPDTLLSLYSPDPEDLATAMRLRPAPRQRANVVIIRPRDESLLAQHNSYIPLPQALADLLTMGGRFPELAEQVIEHYDEAIPSSDTGSLAGPVHSRVDIAWLVMDLGRSGAQVSREIGVVHRLARPQVSHGTTLPARHGQCPRSRGGAVTGLPPSPPRPAFPPHHVGTTYEAPLGGRHRGHSLTS